MERILKGWSADKKYVFENEFGKMMLRTAELSQRERKQQEFIMMEQVHALGVPMPKPVSFEVTDDVKSYFTWCEGQDADDILPTLSKKKQYDLGVASGVYLKQIHSIPASPSKQLWEDYFSEKIDRKIVLYQNCEQSFEGDSVIIEFINQNRHFLKGRPQTFQHGDYHTGNMLISDSNILTIIDFDRFDFGDPWEEFNRIVFSAALSPEFASGQLHGYFQGEPPELFFRLLALYTATNTLSGLPWAMNFGEDEINTMKKQAGQVLDWYANMTTVIPTWYQPNN